MFHSTPSSLSLPSELKHHIAALSSPSSLASLARTHTAYQREAEQALYHTISILTSDNDSLRCMETLAANSDKAALVRFLTMQFPRNKASEDRRAMTYLKALINMHSLSEFRLRMRVKKGDPWIENIAKILCEGHFRLQTLYCDVFLDISRIIKSQTELKILGIYTSFPDDLLRTLKQLHNAQSFLPVILTLTRERFSPVFDHIGIFPAFYSVDRISTIRQVLVETFNKGQSSNMCADMDNVHELSIYLFDSSDMPTIHAFAKEIAVSFPHIGWLNFCFERQCEILSQEMQEVLSCFSGLRELNFYLWSGYDGREKPKILEYVEMAHLKEWEVACPELMQVQLMDGSIHRIRPWF